MRRDKLCRSCWVPSWLIINASLGANAWILITHCAQFVCCFFAAFFAQVGLGWITDLQVTTPSKKEVCVELDGPSHFAFIRSPGGVVSRSHVLGRTAIRNKCLQFMGKRLVSFDSLELSHTNRRNRQKGLELLRTRIQEAASK